MPELVWINGQVTEAAAATVSFWDRGNIFGDGVYEAIKVYQGKLFALKEHLDRLSRSMHALALQIPMTLDELAAITKSLVSQSGLLDALVYMQVTRGSAPRTHVFPQGVEPTVAIAVLNYPAITEDQVKRGIVAITHPDERWAYPSIKSLNLLPNILARQKAYEQGAGEAIFVRSDQTVSEGSTSNIFVYKDQVLITPPADHRILRGITRDVVLNLAAAQGLTVCERDLYLDELLSAEEVFITSTGVEVLPVIQVDGKVIGRGASGPVALKLWASFREKISALL